MDEQLRSSSICSTMFHLAIVILLFGLVESHPVVDGEDGRDNEFPYIVSLRDRDNDHFCGGGIIAEDHILSAFHCLKGTHLSEIRVVAGTSSQTQADPRYTFGIEKVYRFNNKKWLRNKGEVHDDRHDLMILKLNGKIPISDRAKIAKLPKQSVVPGTSILFAGWGETKRANPPDAIQKFTTVILPPSECKESAGEVGFFSPYEICTFSKDGQGMCDGDSGSPLVKDGVLIGVALWVDDKCASGFPDYIANVFYYSDFIEKHLRNPEAIYKNDQSSDVVEIANLFENKGPSLLTKKTT